MKTPPDTFLVYKDLTKQTRTKGPLTHFFLTFELRVLIKTVKFGLKDELLLCQCVRLRSQTETSLTLCVYTSGN